MPEPTNATMVTVALKHPHGLVLRLFKMEDHDEQVMGGGTRTVPRAVLDMDHEPVRLNGYAKKWEDPYPLDSGGNPVLLSGGYALTKVPEDFWEEWLRQNENLDMVKNKLIYAMPRHNDTVDRARNDKDRRSGLEGLNPQDRKDPRVPRGVQKMNAEKQNAA